MCGDFTCVSAYINPHLLRDNNLTYPHLWMQVFILGKNWRVVIYLCAKNSIPGALNIRLMILLYCNVLHTEVVFLAVFVLLTPTFDNRNYLDFTELELCASTYDMVRVMHFGDNVNVVRLCRRTHVRYVVCRGISKCLVVLTHTVCNCGQAYAYAEIPVSPSFGR